MIFFCSFCSGYLECSGGFDDLKIGDKVLMLLAVYEGQYALPDFQNSSSRVGIKLGSFQDDIIQAVRRFIVSGLVEKKDYYIWEKYDPNGLERRIEKQENQ